MSGYDPSSLIFGKKESNASSLIHVNSSVVTWISGFFFWSSGIRIVENPMVEPNVIIRKFFALTAQNCGNAWRSFDVGKLSVVPFRSAGDVFSSLLKQIEKSMVSEQVFESVRDAG